MKKNFFKFVCIALVTACVLPLFAAVPSYASTPYSNYFMSTTDDYSLNLPTPESYRVSKVIDFPDTASGKLLNPEDIFIGPDGRIYIADTGNNRIVILKSDLTFDFEITGFDEDGSKLKNPTCVFVDDDGTILVADYGNKRLVEFTKFGNFRFAYPTPSSDILSQDFNYQPQRVVKDEKGYIYVCSVGDSNGILLLSSDGEFRNYYGTNKVALTFWEMVARLLWSRESRKGTVVTLPYTFNNIFIYDGYVYATTTGYSSAQMRKINPAGSDVLYAGKDFSDMGLLRNSSDLQNFIDVTVDKDLNTYVIDSTYGRIYEYDEWGRNLFAFGTIGTGYGQFSIPKSIEIDDEGRLYVLNGGNNTIYVFEQTDFAKLVHKANKNYSRGKYESADNPEDTTEQDNAFYQWTEVKREDNFYVLALQSIGQILWRKERYAEALDYFYKAEDANWASNAFEELRADFLGQYFSIIATVIVALLVGILVFRSIRKRYRMKHPKGETKPNFFTKAVAFVKEMGHVSIHPIDGFEDIRYENKGTYADAFIIMAIYIVTSCLSKVATSFIYRGGRSLDFINWGSVLLWCILPWVVLCVVNYGVTTILYGEGRFRDVVIGGAYCHVPLIFLQLPLAIVTQVLTLQEKPLYDIVVYISYGWVVLLVFMCMKGVHGFNPLKAVLVFILTAAGVAAVAVLFMIVRGLTEQLIDFIVQFAKELSYLV
ncbi:MAG: YIP1 family protein [Clostridia bacterium]|nr:YIP1 family protein [Clostridia bacterium]